MTLAADTDRFVASRTLRVSATVVLVGLVSLTSLVSYLLYHTLAEVVFAVVGLSVLIMAWALREFLEDDFAVFVGVALSVVAVLHLIHMLDFPGVDVISDSVDHPTQLWIASRFIVAGSFAVAPFVLGRRLLMRYVLAVYVVISALVLATIYWWDVFPSALDEVTGLTTFKRSSEYVVCLLLTLAMVLLWRRRSRLPRGMLLPLLAALASSIAAELFFTLYVGPDTWPNMLGHVFLMLSAVFVYIGLVEDGLARPHAIAYAGLRQAHAELREAQRLHQLLEQSLKPALDIDHPRLSVVTRVQLGERHLELGGDFIDVLPRDEGGLAVICGDVSGHGPSAAALGAVLRASWEALLVSGAQSRTIVESLRGVLCRERKDADTFATLCLAWIDPMSRSVELLNVGHPAPLLVTDTVRRLESRPLPPIGSVDLPVERPARHALPPGWRLFFYTDGLIEGRMSSVSSERFGEERLIELLDELGCGRLDGDCLDRLFGGIEGAVVEPSGDDVAVVVVAERD
jgi:hypothetical protein